MRDALLRFVPAGMTLDKRPVDSDPHVIHVDTGGGRFDHHHTNDHALSAAELVRRAIAPADSALARIVQKRHRHRSCRHRPFDDLQHQ